MTNRNNLLAELINKDGYINHLKEIESELSVNLSEKLSTLYSLPFNEQYAEWKELSIKIKDFDRLSKLANPYYIGFGNPDSKILIIGKEKAFNNNPELLFLESINNLSQWNRLMNEKVEWGKSIIPVFDPRCPRLYHHNIPKRTWFKYCIFLSTFLNKKITPDTLFESSFDNSFFKYCFCTELNHIPSSKTKDIPISSNRAKFLTNKFYRDFNYVLIAGVTSLDRNHQKQRIKIKEIFKAELIKDSISLKDSGRRAIKLYKSDNQIIVTCAQLGGGARWRNEHLKELGLMMQRIPVNSNLKKYDWNTKTLNWELND